MWGRKQREAINTATEIELEQEYAIVSIPQNTVELTIFAKVYLDGEIKTVTTKYGMSEVREAIEEAEQGYIPSDGKYVLTEKGKRVAELIDNGMSYEDACAACEDL